mgnify:CR=1 FL=1
MSVCRNATNEKGEKLSVIALPCPAPVYYDGARLPASYANFYIANGVVLAPVFDDPHDAKALGILQSCFPSAGSSDYAAMKSSPAWARFTVSRNKSLKRLVPEALACAN